QLADDARLTEAGGDVRQHACRDHQHDEADEELENLVFRQMWHNTSPHQAAAAHSNVEMRKEVLKNLPCELAKSVKEIASMAGTLAGAIRHQTKVRHRLTLGGLFLRIILDRRDNAGERFVEQHFAILNRPLVGKGDLLDAALELRRHVARPQLERMQHLLARGPVLREDQD